MDIKEEAAQESSPKDENEGEKVEETHVVLIGERIPEQSFLENEKEEIHDTKDASEIDNPYGKVKDSIEFIKHETIESFQGNEKESNQLEETTPEINRGQSYATDIQDIGEINISNEEVEKRLGTPCNLK
ncbi:hypothetical protein QJS10_CPA01g02246 [Acorus calamus]|uniref:Uncharacterized protein n=1 Tax=Acorus calamus TaxID=4465 RepID=A0AAV9FVA7_ACOCL|nr:hypothetical protein QJS10_CPA01g02246 [Acorus calamus]